MYIERIQESLAQALKSMGAPGDVSVELTGDLSHGDITSNAALVYAKILDTTPRALAESLVASLPPIEGIELVSVAGPGFINFTLSAETVHGLLADTLTKGEEWGEGVLLEGKTIMVEHSQPNPFKPFHIGHLMSNTIGESLVRLLEFQQARVVRANYQGDVGLHVAKALWGVAKLGTDSKDVDALGKAYAHGAQAYEKDESAKAEIDALNVIVYEKSDGEVNDLYEAGRKASLERFNEIYQILGSSFDRFYFESETAPLGAKIVAAHPDVFPESNGARVFEGEKYGYHTRVFLTSKGLPTYEAKELGLEVLKDQEYPECDELIITTAVEQKGVFQVVKKALEIIRPELGAKLSHITHGMMLLPTGKMSSRTGEVVTGESLLIALTEKARERAKESRADDVQILAESIAVAAIKFQILKQATGKDAIFEEERALALEGDSGPYVQYAHARCTSVLEKAAAAGIVPEIQSGASGMLERLVIRFPHVLERAAHERAPHHVAQYLLEVTSAFNSWYANEQILDGSDTVPHKLALVQAVAHTLRNGLYVLGIKAPERM